MGTVLDLWMMIVVSVTCLDAGDIDAMIRLDLVVCTQAFSPTVGVLGQSEMWTIEDTDLAAKADSHWVSCVKPSCHNGHHV